MPFTPNAGIKIKPESENNTVENNTVKGSGQSAIVVEGAGEDGISENNIIKNTQTIALFFKKRNIFWRSPFSYHVKF